MRALWTTGLGLTLGCLVGVTEAGEPVWRPASGKTAAAAWPTPPRPTARSNGVSLERPRAFPPILIPAEPRPIVDSGIHQVSYCPAPAALAQPVVVRAQSSDASPPTLPAPVWPSDGATPSVLPPPTPLPVPLAASAVTSPQYTPAVATAPPTAAPLPTGVVAAAPSAATTAVPALVSPPPPADSCGPDQDLMASKPEMTTEAMLPGEEMIVTSEAMFAESSRFWVSGEYLLWGIKNDRYPVLAATGPVLNPNFPLDRVGILGNRGTVPLFGGGDVDSQMRSGARFSGGYWFDPCNQVGIDGSIFFLGQRSARFNASSGQFPVITRPFFDVIGGREGAEAVAAPGFFNGRIAIDAPSRLWGADINLRKNLLCGCFHRVDLLGGFRYLDLEESVRIREDIAADIDPQFLVNQDDPDIQRLSSFNGANLIVVDQFSTRNRFYGGQLGTAIELRRGRWVLDCRAKVGLGLTHQTVEINGSTTVTRAGGAQQFFSGGLLTAPSNIGRYNRDRFSVVPEVGLTLGYQLTDHMKVFAGYNFLYWTNVVRPGGQIDRNINTNLVPSLAVTAGRRGNNGGNPPLPAPQLRETDFWAQGVNFGIEFAY